MNFDDIKNWARENKSVAIAVAVILFIAAVAAFGGAVVVPDVLP